jgi:hypothetical protein
MKARLDWAPRGLAVCCVLACASATTSAALAQEAPAATAADDEEEEEAGFEETKPASDSPKEDAAKEEDEEPTAAAGTTADAPAAPAASDDDPERQRVVAAVGLELVPSSGYPEPYVRGIAGGSLRSLFHGLQWPQLPYIAGGPKTRLGFSGGGWVDTSYRSSEAGLADQGTDYDRVQWLQQSRFVLRATPTYSLESGWFVQGQAELVANSDVPSANQLVDTDDLWIRAGKWDVFDIHVGRFQGWEIYHLGMGLDLNTFERAGAVSGTNTPVGLYGVNYFWDRPSGAGNIAAHLFPTDFLRIELLGRFGALSSGLNLASVRPVGIVDFGFVKFKVGAEYGKQTRPERGDPVCDASGNCRDPFPQYRTERGAGASLQFVLAPYAEAGFSYATALVDARTQLDTPDLAATNDTTSYGGFLNVSVSGPVTFGDPGDLVIGGGIHSTKQNNELVNPTTGKNNYYTHSQMFAAVQYTLWQRLAIKVVYAHASAGFHPLSDTTPVEYDNTATSYRLRVAYDF